GSGPSFRPQLSRDGKLLAYARRHDARTELRVRDLETGDERVLAARVTRDASEGGVAQDIIPGYAFTPDSRSIVIAIGGKIHRLSVADGSDQIIPYHAHVAFQVAERVKVQRRIEGDSITARIIRWPRVSPSGRQLVFSSQIGRASCR